MNPMTSLSSVDEDVTPPSSKAQVSNLSFSLIILEDY